MSNISNIISKHSDILNLIIENKFNEIDLSDVLKSPSLSVFYYQKFHQKIHHDIMIELQKAACMDPSGCFLFAGLNGADVVFCQTECFNLLQIKQYSLSDYYMYVFHFSKIPGSDIELCIDIIIKSNDPKMALRLFTEQKNLEFENIIKLKNIISLNKNCLKKFNKEITRRALE